MARRVEAENPEESLLRAFDKDSGSACIAPEELFTENYADVPDDLKTIVSEQNGLPCDGGGVPGEWCQTKRIGGCHWMRRVKSIKSQRLYPGGPKFTLIKLHRK